MDKNKPNGVKKKTESQMWVIARNIEDPAWSEPSAGKAEATQEDVAVSRGNDTIHRKPSRLKDTANRNTLENRDPTSGGLRRNYFPDVDERHVAPRN